MQPSLAQQLLRSLERGPDTLSSLARQYTGPHGPGAVGSALAALVDEGRVAARPGSAGRVFYELAGSDPEAALGELTRLGQQASALARKLRVSFDAALKLTAVSIPLSGVLRALVRETER